jgi:hypothetical protein
MSLPGRNAESKLAADPGAERAHHLHQRQEGTCAGLGTTRRYRTNVVVGWARRLISEPIKRRGATTAIKDRQPQ